MLEDELRSFLLFASVEMNQRAVKDKIWYLLTDS